MPEGKKEIVLKLTPEQQEQLKKETGKEVTELRIDAVEGRVIPRITPG